MSRVQLNIFNIEKAFMMSLGIEFIMKTDV
jgi:hypothetical protein